MKIQEKAFHIIYDIIGVVIRWDKQKLSDKEAMNEIIGILATHGEDEEEFVETKYQKKSSSIHKKLIAPIAISALFIGILFGSGTLIPDMTNTVSQLPTAEQDIRFEQLDEEISEGTEKITNNTSIEEFSNLTKP